MYTIMLMSMVLNKFNLKTQSTINQSIEVTIMKLKMREVSVKYKTRKHGEVVKIESPEMAVECFRKVVDDDTQEHVVALFLDYQNQLIGYSVIGKGSDCESIASIRITMQKALLVATNKLILMHNHPSNLVDPSPEDIELTKKYIDAGQLLEITLLDHIVVGLGQCHSIHCNMPELFESQNQ